MNPHYPGNHGQMPPTGYGAPPPGPGQMRPPGPGQNMYNGSEQNNMYNGPPTGPQGQQFGGSYGMKPNTGPGNYGMPPQPTQNGPQPGNFSQTGGPQGDSQLSGPRGPMSYGPGKPPLGGQFQRPPVSVPNSVGGGMMGSPQRFNAPPQTMGGPPTSSHQLANNMGSMSLTGAPNRLTSGMGQPTTIMGPPPTSSGHLPNRMGGTPGLPTSVGPPSSNMGMQQPNYGGVPTSMGSPPVSSMGPPPMTGMGPPPMSGMGPPPVSGVGQPPVSGMGRPPTTGPPTSFGQTSHGQTGPPSGPPGMSTSQPGSFPPPPGGTQTSMGGNMPPPPGQFSGYSMSQGGTNMGQYPDTQGGQYMGGTMPGQTFPPQPFPGQSGQRMPGPGMSGPGGMPGPGGMSGPGAMQQPASRKLDPDQMPSPIQVIEDDIANRSGTYQNGTRGQVPPLVTTKFTVQDQGVCNPRLMRSTMYNIPCTADMLKTSHIPFALNISPFAKIPEDEQHPPIVDLGEVGPVRCKRCKAYMNPYMMFIDGGRRFQCVFCGAATDVPAEYFAHLDHTGKRVDFYDRPELCLGSYEFVATKDYCKNGLVPNSPAFIFMIDVSYNSVKSGLVHLICERLKDEVLVNLPKETGADESEIRVGFVTYAKEIHFYNVKSNLAQPQMLVVSDLDDVFVPLLDGFLVKLSESEAVIDSLLSQIPQMFAESRETETVLGPVIQAGLDALKSADRSGKLYIFHTSLPIAEAPGKLKNRDDRKLLGTEKEKTILTPQNNFYTKLGQECVGAGCSVDLFLFPNAYVDVATISEVSRLTGGNIYKYSYFQADLDGDRFMEDLKQNVQNQTAFDAILRVRTSTGIRAVDFLGNFYMANTTDVELAAIDSEHAVNVEVKHDDKLSESEGAYIQVAVLYTSVSGQRRLRILNQSLNCCTQMADLFRNCELDALVNFLAKQMIRTSLNTNPKQVREAVMNQVAQILACYRKNCASPSSAGQLILPECMKLLPLYANCVIKSDGLQGGTEISTDDRSYLMHLINSMDVTSSHVFFYPRLIPIHDATAESLKLPKAIRCSADRLHDNGVYILENGISMFMWIGHNVDPHWIQEVFSVQSAAQVDIDKCKLMDLDNPTSQSVRQIIQQVRQDRKRYMKLTVVRQRDKLEPWFNHFLVEDKGGMNGTASYVDFLCHIHKEIRNLLT